MRYIQTIIMLCILSTTTAHSAPFDLASSPLNNNAKNLLRAGEAPIINVAVQSITKQQAMDVLASGLHTRSCNWAMRKLSQYESYPSFIDFIKKASYQESNQQLYFSMNSIWMPFPLMLIFYIPRIKNAGQYPFEFRDGFLKGLRGEIHLYDEQILSHKRCLFTIVAKWQGEASPLPNFALETMVKTILQIGMEKLFRISQ